ncbi:lantibiotic dehydratase, partial [Nonomuraea sp. K274]
MGEHDWTLLPTVVVRSAGFPWEFVLSLACPQAAEAAAAVVRLERQALELLAGAQTRPQPPPATGRGSGGRLPRGLRGRLRDLRPLPSGTPGPEGWPADWNRVTGLLEEARLALADAVAADAPLARAAIAGIAADERFLDAVVCSSPDLYRELRRRPTGLRPRRQVAAYAQGLCATGEPVGFFAPIAYGRIEPGQTSRYTWPGHHRDHLRRVAFPAPRVGEALQQRVLADPGLVAGLVPRRKTWAGPAHDGAAFAGHCDGHRTLAEIAAASGTGMERAAAALAVAVRRGLLTHDLCPPDTLTDPFGWLRDRLPAAEPPGVPDHGLVAAQGVPQQRRRALTGVRTVLGTDLPVARRVKEIAELLDRYPAASPDVKLAVQSRIESLAGGRRAGRPSDDDVVVYEAAAATLRVTVGDPLAADLRGRMHRVLDLLAEEAELTRVRTNRLLAGRLGPGTFPLAEVLGVAGDLEVRHGDRLAGRIAAIVRAAPPGIASLDLAGRLGEPVPPAAPVLCAADVMVAAPSLEAYEPGVTPLVLGGLHDTALLTPWALQFHPKGAARLAERDEAIARALTGFTALNVVARRTAGLPPVEFPGLVLELGGVSADPRRRRVGLDELYVHCDGRHAVLRTKGMDEPLMFHNGDHDTALHTALALPRIRPPA